MNDNHPQLSFALYRYAVKLIDMFDQIEAQQHGEHEKGISKSRGSVLVFLPGIFEINELDDILSRVAKERR